MHYPNFPKECSSLLCKYLTPEVFETLKEKKTGYGFTLEQAIRSGVENVDSGIGVYAGDEESYDLFAPCLTRSFRNTTGFPKKTAIKAI